MADTKEAVKEIREELKDETETEQSAPTNNGTSDVIKVENGKVKTEVADDEETPEQTAEDKGDPNLESLIVRQVEYYFGNINLPKDKFLQEQIKLDDGWVPMDVMMKFKRLAELSRKPETILAVLKNSSSLMEVNEDDKKVRRSPSNPLPENIEEYQKSLSDRTVYCKGFPQTSTTMGMLLEFFKPYGAIENITMRKYKDKKTNQWIFKGSVFIVFKEKELVEKFLALESVKFEDTELIRKTQQAYIAEKKKERDERWGKKVNKKEEKTDKSEEKVKKKEFPKGCILHVTGINSEINRDGVKEVLTNLGADVAYIQFDKGDNEAWVRLHSETDGAADMFLKKMEESGKKVEMDGKEVEMKKLEGEEEEKFLEKTRADLQKFHQKHNQGRSRGGWRGKGNRGGYRGNKRSRSPVTDGPTPAKQVATST